MVAVPVVVGGAPLRLPRWPLPLLVVGVVVPLALLPCVLLAFALALVALLWWAFLGVVVLLALGVGASAFATWRLGAGGHEDRLLEGRDGLHDLPRDLAAGDVEAHGQSNAPRVVALALYQSAYFSTSSSVPMPTKMKAHLAASAPAMTAIMDLGVFLSGRHELALLSRCSVWTPLAALAARRCASGFICLSGANIVR